MSPPSHWRLVERIERMQGRFGCADRGRRPSAVPIGRRKVLAGLAAAPAAASLPDDGGGWTAPGPPQQARALSGYRVRPPWRVAGIDYAVGPRRPPRTPPTALAMPGVALDATRRFVFVRGEAITLEGVDFAAEGGWIVIVEGARTSLLDCRLAAPGVRSAYLLQAGGRSLTVTGCDIDGSGAPPGQSSLVAFSGQELALRHNRLRNFSQHALEMVQPRDAPVTLAYEYNLIEEGGQERGAHLNFLQWAGGRADGVRVRFNTSVQHRQAAGGEGYQFYFNDSGSMRDAELACNTMIARSGAGGVAMSYMVNFISERTVAGDRLVARDNYFDLEGAYGAFYPQKSAAWRFSGNRDMRTGAVLLPQVPR